MKVDDEENGDHTPDWRGWTDRETNIGEDNGEVQYQRG